MKSLKILLWVTLFSIAMGLLETSVVIYLRELYYPNGFSFPLKMLNSQIALTELFREAATIIMLICVGILSGRNRNEKFGYFIYTFAIWDIFYYVFLKLLLNWPQSFLTWDVLFLIPTTWVGPVITPIMLSIAMIVLFLAIHYFTNRGYNITFSLLEWILLIIGSIICIISFTWEYTSYLLMQYKFSEIFVLNDSLSEYAIQFIPQQFPWLIFWLGFFLILGGIALFTYRNSKKHTLNKIN